MSLQVEKKKMKNFLDLSFERKRDKNGNEIKSGVSTLYVSDENNAYAVDGMEHASREYIKTKAYKRLLKRKMSVYVNSFTVHGLTRIVTGNKIEKLIWTSILIMALSAAVLITQGYVKKYFAHDIYLDAHSVIDEKAYHPTVTFCLGEFFNKYNAFYCGHPVFEHPNIMSPCIGKNFPSHLPYKERPGALWSNGIFHVTNCFANTNCVSDEYFRSSDNTQGACISWNWNRTLYQIYNKAVIEFEIENEVFEKFSHEPLIYTTVHDHALQGEFLNHQIEIIPGQTYYLQVVKKVIKRLAHPFPANCTKKRPTDYFPGEYNRRSCIIMDFDVKTYKRCGGIRDFTVQYIPEEIKEKYNQNTSIFDMMGCFMGDSIDESQPDCPVPCRETGYDVNSFVIPMKPTSDKTTSKYSIQIGYQSPDTFNVFEEKEMYSWDKLLSEFGGLLGLVIGASVLSMVEIIIYLVLCVMKKLA